MPRVISTILLCFLLALTATIYAPGLDGFFVFDDISSIVNNAGIHITRLDWESLRQAVLAETAGPLGRPLSALSFAFNHLVADLDPWYYKATNLLIHLINGLLLWLLLGRLLDRLPDSTNHRPSQAETRMLALLVTAVWLLHPINLTGVLYVVQRMNSLATTFTLLGLLCYLLARTRSGRHMVQPGWLLGTLAATATAALCKENGLLLPALALLMEFVLFGGRTATARDRTLLAGFFTVTVLLPGVATLGLLALSPDTLLGGYKLRDFSLMERALTQGRVLWFHIGQLFIPRPNSFNLYHDSFSLSRGLLDPPTTLLALLGLLCAMVGALLLRRRQPVISFGVLFFMLGHAMESTILPLELVFEHRNYLPSVGLLLAGGYGLLYSPPFPPARKNRVMIALVFLLVCGSVTALRVQHWRTPLAFATAQVQHQPDSVRARNQLGQIYAQLARGMEPPQRDRLYQLARENLGRAATLQAGNVISLITLIELAFSLEQPLEPRWFEALHQRLARERLIAGSGFRLYELFLCQLEGPCSIDPRVLEVLIDAALDNDQLHPTIRSNVLFTRAYFLVHMANDADAAVAAARRAVTDYPGNLRNRLNLVELLISLGRLAEAEVELDTVRDLDRHGALAAPIHARAEKLEQARNSTGEEPPSAS